MQRQRPRPAETPNIPRQPANQIRLPPRADGRDFNSDLQQLDDVKAQQENQYNKEMSDSRTRHTLWNNDFEDLTREPLAPVRQGAGFRPAAAQYQLLTPPTSVDSGSLDHPSPAQDKPTQDNNELVPFKYGSVKPEDGDSVQPRGFRRRVGRNGLLWIDRRGLPSTQAVVSEDDGDESSKDDFFLDRWKYDEDSDEEQPVFHKDPYGTSALRFRSTIPVPPHLVPARIRQEAAPQGRPNGPSPTNNRTIAAAPQTLAT